VRRAREAASRAGVPSVPIIAKIERPQAVERLDEILHEANGIMIARGDLGLELPLEHVPQVQRAATAQARALGLPVIVATQVLDSMRTEPRPTRAEVSDAAHAVDDQVDAIMLAGETAVGLAPAHVVRTLDAIIRDAETGPAHAQAPERRVRPQPDGSPVFSHALCESAVTLAAVSRADAIVAITRTGRTARLLAASRPGVPVYAITGDASAARRLALTWGVIPVLCELGDAMTPAVPLARSLLSSDMLAEGATVVLVSVHPDPARADSNFLKLQRL